MKKVLFPLVAALGLCACTAITPLDTPPAELAVALARGAHDSATVTLGQDPQRVLVAAGDATAYLKAVVITGASLRYNDARCATTGRSEVTCTYDGLEIPAGRRFGQPIGGSDVQATVLYQRAQDGPLFAKTLTATPPTPPPSAEPCPGC